MLSFLCFYFQWVQCDKCESWQHQVCALFNIRRNEGQAEYTCPPCYIAAIESGERKPLPQSTVLGAKDLPRTVLSDHIEQRLAKKLKQERQGRAKLAGKNFDEVLFHIFVMMSTGALSLNLVVFFLSFESHFMLCLTKDVNADRLYAYTHLA